MSEPRDPLREALEALALKLETTGDSRDDSEFAAMIRVAIATHPPGEALREAFVAGLKRTWARADYPRLSTEFEVWARAEAERRYPRQPSEAWMPLPEPPRQPAPDRDSDLDPTADELAQMTETGIKGPIPGLGEVGGATEPAPEPKETPPIDGQCDTCGHLYTDLMMADHHEKDYPGHTVVWNYPVEPEEVGKP